MDGLKSLPMDGLKSADGWTHVLPMDGLEFAHHIPRERMVEISQRHVITYTP